MAGRCTMGFYNIMGIDDCIASSFDEYIDIAVRLGLFLSQIISLQNHMIHIINSSSSLSVPGLNKAYRSQVSDRIAERSHLLWNRNSTVSEWVQFIEEIVYKKPVTNLHTLRPSAPIPNVGAKFPRLPY